MIMPAAWLLVLLGLSLPVAASEARPLVGKRLPPLHVGEWIRGSAQDVGQWGDGKVYVLDMWGTWCAPCIRNIPELTELQAKYRDRGLVVIGYSWEKPSTVRSFANKMGDRMRYVLVADPEAVTFQALTDREAVESFPYAFLVDRAGTVVWAGNPKDDDLARALARIFGER